MIFAALLSRILGMGREMALSHQFGQGREADIYTAAFMVPDFLFVLLGSGALASVFVPIFTRHLENNEEKKAWLFFSNAATIVGLAITVLIILGEIFVVPLTGLVNKGFAYDKVVATADLTRIVLPAQFCFFVGSILISAQYAYKRFAIPAMGSIIYNSFIILFGLTLGNPMTGLGPAGFSWGALFGAFVGNLLVQIWGVWRIGGHYRFRIDWRDPDVHRFARLMVPIVFTISLPQVDMYVNKFFATFLPGDGAMASLNYANRLMQLPLGILAQASAIVIFPYIAAQAARNDMAGLKRSLNLSIRIILAMTLPASILMIGLAEPIVRVIYQRGQFQPADTRFTATVMVFYCLGIAAWSAQALLARGFYAMQDTARPMITGSVVTVVFIALNWLLVGPMGANGLALSTTIAAIALATALFFQLQHQIGGMHGSLIVRSFLKVCVSGAIMLMPVYGIRAGMTKWLTPGLPDTTTVIGAGPTLFMIVVASVVGLAVYVGMLFVLRVDEARVLARQFSQRLHRGGPTPPADGGPMTASV